MRMSPAAAGARSLAMAENELCIGDQFSSYEDLQIRIRQYEITKNAEFYKRDSRTILSARKRGIKREIRGELQFYQLRYCCINGGKDHQSLSSGQRPKQRTFRKGCPAYISLTVTDDGQYLVIKEINDQHNHNVSQGLFKMLPRERRLPKEELQEAEKLVALQVNNKLLRDHFEEKTGKKIILKDISNIITKVNFSKKSDDLDSLVNKLKKTGSVEVFHDSDGQLLGIFYQDAEMQRLFAAFPEIIFVDATYKLNDRRMPLYIMMVEDSLGQTEVVAICLVHSEEKPVLQQMIKCFKNNNPVFTQIKIIMADKDINERDVFRQEISNALLLICQFHVLRSFNREITTEKMGISAAQRHTALELLQKLVYSSTEKVYENVLAQIQETCPRQIYSYIISNWNDIKAEWVLGLKLCEGSLLNTTNNRLESFNQKLKQVVKLYSCLDVFFEQFIGLINTLRNERDYKGSNDIQKVRVTSDSVDKNSAEHRYAELLTDYANSYVQEQLEKARKVRNIELLNSNDKLFDDGNELCTSSCSCLFWKSMGLPCRHIFLARLLTDMDLYETELCNKRWTRSYYLKNIRVVKTSSPTDSSSNCSSNHGIVTTTTVPPSKEKVVLSENQKFKKAFILAERIAALCAEVGMKEFSERLKTLQKVVELWQSNTAFNVVPKNIQVQDTDNDVRDDDNGMTEELPLQTSNNVKLIHECYVSSELARGINNNDVQETFQNTLDAIPSTSNEIQSTSNELQDVALTVRCTSDVSKGSVIQEFLHLMADTAAAIQAECGKSLIEEDAVTVNTDELLPHAELLLNLEIQIKAKKYFSEDAWKTAESTLHVLEDQYLKHVKRQEFPPLRSESKGKGKKSAVLQVQEPINWIKRAQQHHVFIEEFIKSYKPQKCLPVVGENIAGVGRYKDKSAFLTDDERTSLTSYLCSTYKELRVPSSIITYIIHDTIQFITSNFTNVDGNKSINDQEEDASTVQDKTPPPNNARITLKEIKLPPKMRVKGRPKGSNHTVIGLLKKSKLSMKTQAKPFFKKSNKDKEKVILEWIVGKETANEAVMGKVVGEDAVTGIASTCTDSYVDLSVVKQYFSPEGWLKVNKVVEEKRKKPDYMCQNCMSCIDFDFPNVVCDSCLNVFHLQCVGLHNLPKSRYWYCKECKKQ